VDRNELLADVLAEFAHNLGEGFDIQEILDHLVGRIVDVLPVTGAGVMLMGPGDDLHFVAASDEEILMIQTLQNELDEGPCLEAYRTGDPVSVPDLSRDARFPRFSSRACEAGLAAVFTFPMSLDGGRLGALDLYRDQIGELDGPEMKAAQVLADVAAAYIRNARDRADSEASLGVLRQRSLHDPLTGLPNRTLLKERLEQAVARASRSNQVVAVLFVDLDGFKRVNDRFGHDMGDRVLVAVAGRLRRVLRSGDTLARLSGDEFVIICEGLERSELAERVADRITEALASVFDLGDGAVKISASVGLAFCGPAQEMPETLLRDADFAMYEAKQAGGGRHHVSDPAVRLAVDRRGQLSRELREARARDEFQLAYQPLVDIADGTVVAVEALLRWQHPDRGWVMPSEILPIAEPTGLILEIGEWVLAQACRDLRHWQHRYGAAIPRVSVNVSAYQVMAPGFDGMVERVLDATGIDPAAVQLEVTESAFIEDGARALSVLEETKKLGVGLALDDFGTGYSSLNYLRQYPFDMLKIDRAFIGDVDTNPTTRKIVASIIELAHGLNLSVVAEGVETPGQLTQLRALGTDRAQGYYLCRPLLIEQLDQSVLETANGTPVTLPLPRHHQ
jgi:diguanylate cyclase (GGDEF)-like protein